MNRSPIDTDALLDTTDAPICDADADDDPAPELDERRDYRSLSEVFDEPACRVEIVAVPDGERCCYSGYADEVLSGLLHDADHLRAGTLAVEVALADDPEEREEAWREWLALGEDPAFFGGERGWRVYEIPLVLVRNYGALVVTWTHDALADAANDAVDLCERLAKWLCRDYGWTREELPLAAAVVATGSEVARGARLALPEWNVIGRSELWRAADRLGAIRHDGTRSATQLERFFSDLADLGTFMRTDRFLECIELPAAALRRV